MLKKSLRKEMILRNREQIDRLFCEGRRISTPYFHVLLITNHHDNKMLVGAARSIGSHARRNRAKRRLRELYRLYRHRLPEGVMLGILAKEKCINCSYQELQAAFLNTLSRL